VTAKLSRRARRRRLWLLLGTVAVVALATFQVTRTLGCSSHPLDVTMSIRNTGATAIDSLSVDQVDGPGHVIVPPLAPGATATVKLIADDRPEVSRLDLVDDATGHNYSLPPHQFSGRLHGTIDVEVARAGSGAGLSGRARSQTDSGSDPRGWEPLKED
jgi:hypothetical protein